MEEEQMEEEEEPRNNQGEQSKLSKNPRWKKRKLTLAKIVTSKKVDSPIWYLIQPSIRLQEIKKQFAWI